MLAALTAAPLAVWAGPLTDALLVPSCRLTSTGSSSVPLVRDLMVTVTGTAPFASGSFCKLAPFSEMVTLPVNLQPLLNFNVPRTVSPGFTVPPLNSLWQPWAGDVVLVVLDVGLVLDVVDDEELDELELLDEVLVWARARVNGDAKKLSTNAMKTATTARSSRTSSARCTRRCGTRRRGSGRRV